MCGRLRLLRKTRDPGNVLKVLQGRGRQDTLRRGRGAAPPEPAPAIAAPMVTEPEPEPAADAPMCLPVGGAGGAEKPTGSVEKKKKKNRCMHCRKKVGLTGFECKCGGLFCGMHRMAGAHACTFDHAAMNKELLEKRVTSVIADKMEKI